MKEDAMDGFFISDIEAATYVGFLLIENVSINGFTDSGRQSRHK